MFVGRREGDRLIGAQVPGPGRALLIAVCSALLALLFGDVGYIGVWAAATELHHTQQDRIVVGVVATMFLVAAAALLWKAWRHLQVWRLYRRPWRRLWE